MKLVSDFGRMKKYAEGAVEVITSACEKSGEVWAAAYENDLVVAGTSGWYRTNDADEAAKLAFAKARGEI